MKKLFLFATLLAFASCSNDDNTQNDPINEPQPVIMKNKLKSHMMKSSFGTLFDFKYEYNDLGYVSKVISTFPHGTETYTYSYQGNKLMTIDHDRGGDDYFSTFTYEGELIVQELINNDWGDVLVNYSYNSDGELIRATKSTLDEEFPEYNYVFQITDYTYVNHNVESEVSKEYDINRQEIRRSEKYFEYDNYKHPTTLSFPENFRKIKLERKNNEITRYIADYALEIKYNSENYPVMINDAVRVQNFVYYE